MRPRIESRWSGRRTTAHPGTLSAMRLSFRSKMVPRGAGTVSCRSRLLSARSSQVVGEALRDVIEGAVLEDVGIFDEPEGQEAGRIVPGQGPNVHPGDAR